MRFQQEDVFNNLDSFLEEVKVKESKKKKKTYKGTINGFVGNYDFLSNLFCRPQTSIIYFNTVNEKGQEMLTSVMETAPTLEHLFQMSKTINREQQLKIKEAHTPLQARRLGSKVDLISNWDEKRVPVMKSLLEDKFSQHFDLRLKLLVTNGFKLVNESPLNEPYWATKNGNGENMLGKLLEEVRGRIIRDSGSPKEILQAYLSRDGLGFICDWFEENKMKIV
jgi:ribA/ribD-fused uncharacterized protein